MPISYTLSVTEVMDLLAYLNQDPYLPQNICQLYSQLAASAQAGLGLGETSSNQEPNLRTGTDLWNYFQVFFFPLISSAS